MNNDQVIGFVFHESVMNEADFRSVREVKNGIVRIETVLQEVNVPNRNNRTYPKHVIENALQSAFIKEKLATNSWLGESNHPNSKEMQRQLSVDMNNVSHVVKSTSWDPKDPNLLIGIVETAGTTTGKNMAGLILENGMQCSFSMRGLGDVTKGANGSVTVKAPMRLVCYDLVHFPSHIKAYQRQVISESSPITLDTIATYAAKNSDNFQQLNENFLQETFSDLKFSLDTKRHLVVSDAASGKNLAIILPEKKMMNELNSILKNYSC